MMLRALFRSGPKYFIAGAILLISVGGFGLWLVKRHQPERPSVPQPLISTKEDTSEKLARIESRIDSLILVDNSLYDIETGELLFPNWLKNGMPVAAFYDRNGKHILARYEKGFARYALDGTEEAVLVQRSPPAFADDLSFAVYARDKDLWRAGIDWKDFQFRNERRLTSIEGFNEQNFAANILMGTDDVIVVRNMTKLLRVDLNSGAVRPTRIPLGDFGKRRSPSGRYLVGVEKGEFYCYDVEADNLQTIPLGQRTGLSDYQWLGEDRCAVIAGSETVIVYDRAKNLFSERVLLPLKCVKLGEPSADGRFAFCQGRNGAILVDFQRKEAKPVEAGVGVVWISADTFVYAREVPDSDLRGTWMQGLKGPPMRLSPSPYLVAHSGPMLLVTSKDLVVFATKHNLAWSRPDGENGEIVKLPHPPEHVMTIGEWRKD